jgi:hypothetical protein
MMKKTKYIIAGLIFIAFAIVACDKIDEPYAEKSGTVESERKVILEEFTGHKCPNCPAGSKIAQDLKSIYGERLIIVSLHAGWYAEPDASGLYTADFMNASSTELEADYGIQYYPAGLVNRMEYDGSLVLSKDKWISAVTSLMGTMEEASLEIEHTYNKNTRALSIDVGTIFSSVGSESYKVCAYITADTISPQKNSDEDLGPSPNWEEYEHHGILIEAISGTYGKQLNNGVEPNPDETYSVSFQTTLEEGWNAENCYIVAFVYEADSKEIIQAEEVDLIAEE